jgi:hypothetical protein
VGAEECFVALPPDRDPQPVRRFLCFTEDLHALARWLMELTGVHWITGAETESSGTRLTGGHESTIGESVLTARAAAAREFAPIVAPSASFLRQKCDPKAAFRGLTILLTACARPAKFFSNSSRRIGQLQL